MIRNFIEQLKEKGMTQNEIAERTGLKQSFISQLYNGKKPSLDTVLRFAKAFNATTDKVLNYNPDPKRNANTHQDLEESKPRNL